MISKRYLNILKGNVKNLLDPKLIKVWSCSEKKKNSKPTTNSCDTEKLPSYMKQALIEKEKIDLTYDTTSATETSIPMTNASANADKSEFEEPCKNSEEHTSILKINGKVQPDELELETEPCTYNSNIFDSFQTNVASTNKFNGQNSNNNYVNVPYIGSLAPPSHTTVNTNPTHVFIPVITHLPSFVPQNVTNGPCMVPNNLPNAVKPLTVKVCDASTSTDSLDVETELKKKLENCNKRMNDYRRKIKLLGQCNRRYQSKLIKLKHSIFNQLQERQYVSNDLDFKINEEGCLYDRHSLKLICYFSVDEINLCNGQIFKLHLMHF